MKALNYDSSKLNELCHAYNVKRLSVFGSTLRGDDSDHSDLDILVDLGKQHNVGLLRFYRLQRELSDLFGRTVDLNTAGFLDRSFRDDVIHNAKAIYEE